MPSPETIERGTGERGLPTEPASAWVQDRLRQVLTRPVPPESTARYNDVERFFTRELSIPEAARLHTQISNRRDSLRKLMEERLSRASVPRLLNSLRQTSGGYTARTGPERLDDVSLEDTFIGEHNRLLVAPSVPATEHIRAAREARELELYQELSERGLAVSEASKERLDEINTPRTEEDLREQLNKIDAKYAYLSLDKTWILTRLDPKRVAEQRKRAYEERAKLIYIYVADYANEYALELAQTTREITGVHPRDDEIWGTVHWTELGPTYDVVPAFGVRGDFPQWKKAKRSQAVRLLVFDSQTGSLRTRTQLEIDAVISEGLGPLEYISTGKLALKLASAVGKIAYRRTAGPIARRLAATKGSAASPPLSPVKLPRAVVIRGAKGQKSSLKVPAGHLERIAHLPRSSDALLQRALGKKQRLEVIWSKKLYTVYVTSAGQLVGSHKSLRRFAKRFHQDGHKPYEGWDSHHIIEEVHLKNLGIRSHFPPRGDLPCVLLPKEAHRRIGSQLRPADSAKQLSLSSERYSAEYAREAKLLYEDYRSAYDLMGRYTGIGSEAQIKKEFLSIVKLMLGFE